MTHNMGETNQHIHCTVSNCHYYGEGNICAATEIMVTSDQVGATKPDRYDHAMAMGAPQTPVDDCTSSCCKTFVEKDS